MRDKSTSLLIEESELSYMENKSTLGRHFVIGDTHARADLVQKLMDNNVFNVEQDYIYFLGDYYSDGVSADELMNLLSKYYRSDPSEPGFHLLKGNHEYFGRGARCHLNDVFGDLLVSALPNIVVLKISGYTFCLSHCGMHRKLWEKLKDQPSGSEFFLNKVASDNYICRAVNWTHTNDAEISYYDNENTVADYWPQTEKSFFIHGHFPAHKECNIEEYRRSRYKYDSTRMPFEATPVNRVVYYATSVSDTPYYIRYNPLRKAFNIDTGAKSEHGRLACICLEELISTLKEK